MKNVMKLALICAAALVAPTPALAAEHVSKRPLEVHSDLSRPCVIFRLEGVSVADPVVGSAQWFALPRTHPAFAEFFAILLTSRAGSFPISVRTSGAMQCGFAGVDILSTSP